jgi:hypothetical protein
VGPWVLAAAFGYTTLGSATVGVGGVLRVGGLVGAEVVAFAEHEVAIDTVGQVADWKLSLGVSGVSSTQCSKLRMRSWRQSELSVEQKEKDSVIQMSC